MVRMINMSRTAFMKHDSKILRIPRGMTLKLKSNNITSLSEITIDTLIHTTVGYILSAEKQLDVQKEHNSRGMTKTK